MRIAGCLLVLTALCSACDEKAPPRISGKPLISERSHDVWISPTSTYVATLVDPLPSKELGAPQDILLGTLTVVPVAGGKSRALGNDVPNLPGKVLYSKDGAYIACVAGFSVLHNVGELHLAKVAEGSAESLSDGVTYFRFSPVSDQISYISDGVLFIRPTAGGAAKKIAERVSLIEFSPDGKRLLVKHSARAGGDLEMYDVVSGKTTEIAHNVLTFGFSPADDSYVFRATGLAVPAVLEANAAPSHATKDAEGFYRVVGNGPPRRLSKENISDFKFSPDGKRIAWVTPPNGASTVGDLYLTEGDESRKVAPRVMQFEFAPDGTLYLEGVYQAASQAGTLGYLPVTGALVELARDVRAFTITPKGRYVLYSRGVSTNNSFTLALEVHRVGAPPDEKPRRIDTGVFGYAVDKQEERLAYKARCTEGGQACALFVTDLGHTTEPVLVAHRISAFDFAPDPHGLVVVSTQHDSKLTGHLIYSLASIAAQADAPLQILDDQMDGDFMLGGPNHDLAIYVVSELHRSGLYITGLTPPPPVTAAKQ